MAQYRAAWILPISQPPLHNGWIRTDRGRISAFGAYRGGESGPHDEVDLGQAAVLPGLVNAHTHLELSWMRGRVAATDDFPAWIRNVIALQRSAPDPIEVDRAMREAIVSARAAGTVLFGDISNTLATVGALMESRVSAVVFHELIGFQHERAAALIDRARDRLSQIPASDFVRCSLAAHAPYSVSPALFQAIRRELAREPFARCSVHLAESAAEMDFLQDGAGPWRDLLHDLGSWDDTWTAPHCDPVEYLARMRFLDDRALVVHCVQLGRDQLAHLASTRSTLVTCPRGNVLTGAGEPPIAAFYRSGVNLAVGTDSLASVPDLNLFSELVAMRQLAPEVSARAILESATISGARALGFESDFGTLDPGRRDDVIAVSVPSDVTDVEEYLVSGIGPEDICRLGD